MTRAGDLAQALGDRGIFLRRLYRPGERRAPCPQCDRGPRDDALAILVENDCATWFCHRCGWRGGIGRGRSEGAARPAPQVKERAPEPDERYDALAPWGHRLWEACETICRGSIAARYLDHRGCALPHPWDDLRWHRDLEDKVSGFRGPALVGLVTDALTGEAINLHRTWLARDGAGKAPIDKPRRRLKGHPSRGVIRLSPDDDVTLGLVIGEGVETCLAAARSGLAPVWSTLTAGNLTEFPILPGLEGLTVLVDHDRPNPKTGKRAGIEAARAVIARYVAAGFNPERDLLTICSPVEGEDFNDMVAA